MTRGKGTVPWGGRRDGRVVTGLEGGNASQGAMNSRWWKSVGWSIIMGHVSPFLGTFLLHLYQEYKRTPLILFPWVTAMQDG